MSSREPSSREPSSREPSSREPSSRGLPPRESSGEDWHEGSEDHGDSSPGDPVTLDYRRQPPRAVKDLVYSTLVDTRWHSANEFYNSVGTEYLTALADLMRSGYSINRNKNSFNLVTRWPRPPKAVQKAEIEAKVSALTSGVNHDIEEDLNLYRAERGTRDIDGDEGFFDSDNQSDNQEDPDDSDNEDDPDNQDTFSYRDSEAHDNTDGLEIGDGVVLPGKTMVTAKIAILAKSGAGKTSAAIVIAEEMCKKGLPFCVLDPMGVWWGLRAGAASDQGGHPVLVMGGDHGDVSLDVSQGANAAQLVIRRYPQSVILDLCNMIPDDQHVFVAAFCSELYAHNRKALHLFIDEADEFAPQRPEGLMQKGALSAMDRMVRRGRFRGIGITLITQRSAVLHKNVLSQADVLVVMCSVSPADIRAVREWLEGKVSMSDTQECLRSISSLPVGGAYLVGGGRLNIFKKLLFREKETYDASATPVFGDELSEPPSLVEIPDRDAVIGFMGGDSVGDSAGDDEDDNANEE